MSITPRVPHKLHETLGVEAAEDLVTWIEERESRHDDVIARMELGFARIDSRFSELREAMRSDFAELRQEMQVGFARADHRIAEVKADLMKWSLSHTHARLRS